MLKHDPKGSKPEAHCGKLDALPPALHLLTKMKHWMLWRWELNKKGKWTKEPYQSDNPGIHAKSTDPRTWSDYAAALAAYKKHDDVDGIGFALLRGEVVALDLDDCHNPRTGEITPWGQSYVEQAQALGAYVEVTVSGTGLRIIGIGEGAKVHRKFTKIGEGNSSIEAFRKAERYITISGLELGHSSALPNIDALIDSVVARYDTPSDAKSSFSDNSEPLSDANIKELIERGTLNNEAVDRSVMFHRVVWHLAARGETAENIIKRLQKHPKGIAAKFTRPKDRLAKEVQRSFDKFTANTPSVVAAWNWEYAHVLAGGKSAVLQEFTTAEGYIDFKLLSSASFHEWTAEHKVRVGTDADDKPRMMQASKFWLKHPKRRKYQDIGFFPGREAPKGYYNLWRGFAIEPRQGDCSKFLAHLHDNIGQGDDELYGWVIAWFADIFQHPGSKCGTALAVRGKQGTGKTKVGEVFASLLGVHFKQVSDPRYVVGRFNSHMISLLLLHADEGFWAGDKKAEGRLKDLVTGKTHPIEFKGKEAFWINNYVRLFVTGNPDWVVPAGFEERRFATLDAGDEHQQDYAYFAAIDAEMKAGGREALLYHLLFEVDCSKVNLRHIPYTTALLEQKLELASTEQTWWLNVLRNGALPGDTEGKGRAPSAVLFDDYIEHARAKGVQRRVIETSLGMFLQKTVPNLRRNKRNYDVIDAYGLRSSKRGLVYSFPPLAQCRAHFAALLNQDVEWDEEVRWSKWS